MTLAGRLRAMMDALPPSGQLVLTRTSLAELLADEDCGTLAGAAGVDLRVEDVGRLLNRAPSTIRTWAAAGRLPGAYLLAGREWRIPRSAIAAMQIEAAARFHTPSERATRNRPADTGEWRQHVPRS
jgi:hypothetical protein